ncbi:hypothetical protein SAMN05421819_0929 [Bryocella elongata]|uniref:Beta-glucuronidase C-terminal domain-containing protein n=1 Tax=Bryocella elongata TaxID=863522 RepID=A0A1H5U9Q1_9BACT|nr:glycosyl hydrolase family 79 C-terminal domain-containing protein [Bryocella elongata]SEF71760.1 hypothetical protein SAMN05421819_0929 [Bryocella elongata]
MKSRVIRTALCGGTPMAAAILFTLPLLAQSQASVSITLDSTQLRRTIPNDFLGLSFEMSSIMAANNNGAYWMSGASTPLSTMLSKIGVKNIRIGGNSSERTPYATTTDAANVDAFANLIQANLIWNVPVKNNYNASSSVSFVQSMYNDQHVSHSYGFPTNIEIGNEPDNDDGTTGSAISYSTWQSRYDTLSSDFRNQINGSILSTGPSSAGCCTYPNGLETDSTYSGSLKSTIGSVTVHNYPLGSSANFGSVSNGDSLILASTLDAKYQTFYNNFNDNASNNGYNVRIEETNSAYGGSNNGVTNTYAAALWALDYFCYMAYSTNMSGMNLHNGPIGSDSGSYNAVSPIGVSSTPLSLQPPGYGLWVFHYGSQGQPLKTTLTNSSGANITAYGLLETNGGETVHVINRTYGSGAVDATVTVTPGGSYTHAQVIYLQQANSDVTATTGITFGGAAMDSNGNWTGGYGAAQTLSGSTFTFTLPHTQAAIVHFY